MGRIYKLLLWLSLIILIGCGAKEEEEIKIAIESANTYLSLGDCDAALEILTEVGFQNRRSDYLQVYASAYACKAGFSEVSFFGNDVAQLAAGSGSSVFASLTKFSSSPMSSPTDTGFTNLQTAIDTLLYAGGVTTSSHRNRLDVFGSSDTSDMNTQMIYMMLAQLGKYLFYYGNADPTDGKKGAGSTANGNSNGNSNVCFFTYSGANPVAVVDALTTQPCGTGAVYTGHPELSGVTTSLKVTRMCQGLVLLNNFLDVITNTVISTADDAGAIDDVDGVLSTALDTACTTVRTYDASTTVCSLKDQSACETQYASDQNILEVYFAAVFETLFVGD